MSTNPALPCSSFVNSGPLDSQLAICLTCFTLVQRKYYRRVETRPLGCGLLVFFCLGLVLVAFVPLLHHLSVLSFLQ